MKRSGFKRKILSPEEQKEKQRHKDIKDAINALNSKGRRNNDKKFNNIPVWYDGIHFPSILQREHYKEYRILEKANEIAEYDYEVDIPLHKNGVLLGNIRVDHKYYDIKHQCHVIAETKSEATKTPLWAWKWDHLKAEYPEFIYEVRTEHKIQREYPKKDLIIFDYER